MSRRTASLMPRSDAKRRVSKDGPEVRSGPAGPGQSFEAPSGRLRTTEALAADGLPRLSEVVAAHGLEPRKALGQNFLFDLNLTRKIARAGGPLDGVAVVEIGPGPGGLTRALLSEGAAKVIAVERDARALGALAEIAAHWPGRLEIIEGDALRVTRADAGRESRRRPDPHRRQPALQHRDRASDPMARGRAMAAVL